MLNGQVVQLQGVLKVTVSLLAQITSPDVQIKNQQLLALAQKQSIELMWITYLLRDIGMSFSKPLQLLCDSVRALYMSFDPLFHACSKHIELDYHFV